MFVLFFVVVFIAVIFCFVFFATQSEYTMSDLLQYRMYPYSRAQTPDKESSKTQTITKENSSTHSETQSIDEESSSTHTSGEKVESESPKIPAGPAGYVSCNIAVNINFDHYYRINPKSYLAFFNFSLTA